ncbi:MAG: hypothetical protein CL940_08130 [Deltaproteobacteria bacterium]|nr:hypothetical protein [Deltaproteobacteria bacterium]
MKRARRLLGGADDQDAADDRRGAQDARSGCGHRGVWIHERPAQDSVHDQHARQGTSEAQGRRVEQQRRLSRDGRACQHFPASAWRGQQREAGLEMQPTTERYAQGEGAQEQTDGVQRQIR